MMINRLAIVIGATLQLGLALTCSAQTATRAEDGRFLELPTATSTITFDLRTVHMILPDKFSIQFTDVDSPDVMQYKLKALDALRKFCLRSAGTYSLPDDMPVLGRPDRTGEGVYVIGNGGSRSVLWDYPYEALGSGTLDCDGEASPGASATKSQGYYRARNRITNGVTLTEVFDCGHYMMGAPNPADNTQAILVTVRKGSSGEEKYMRVCLAVTKKWPYIRTEAPKSASDARPTPK